MQENGNGDIYIVGTFLVYWNFQVINQVSTRKNQMYQ